MLPIEIKIHCRSYTAPLQKYSRPDLLKLQVEWHRVTLFAILCQTAHCEHGPFKEVKSMVVDIRKRGSNPNAAPLHPSCELHLVTRNSNLEDQRPAVTIDKDIAHTEVVLLDPQKGEEMVLFRGKRFDSHLFDLKKNRT